MRKLIVSMNITLDGFMAGPQQQLDWHSKSWCEDMSEYLTTELGKASTILLGRNTYEKMAAFWPTRVNCLQCARNDIAYSAMMNAHEKVVYSNTVTSSKWSNTKFINGSLVQCIEDLKKLPGKRDKNIICYGSGKLVSTLMQLHLVDEYQLWLHPIVLHKGSALFNAINEVMCLQLLHTKTFTSGVVLLHYKAGL